ncbi:MAG: hypothetical protein QF441_04255 [Bacteriovoracaceae bacterium]|nr:hypothetical protein [Halobacteriovoraceae bacterium]MDP7319793.1 hypothetical protein [Bacteriovoracaceae bacterium]
MVKNKNLFLSILLCGVLVACALQSRKDQDSLRAFFEQKEFKRALEYLEASSLKEDETNKLLYLMELGNLLYYQKKYSQAANVFVKANQLVDKLYTKSVKEALVSSVLNDNSKSFYGSIFERSQLYFMQALSFYQLAEQGFYFKKVIKDGGKSEQQVKLSQNEIKRNKDRVRSTLIAWDSFFQEISRMRGVKTFLKYDLLAKQFAGLLHEALNTKRDNEIAFQLYKDALRILEEIGPTYSIYNQEYKKYNQQLKDFYNGEISKSNVKAKLHTDEYQRSKSHLHFKILSLAKKYRRNEYTRLLRQLNPSKKVLSHLKTSKNSNVIIHVEKGMISKLRGKDFSYNLRSAISKIEDPNKRALINGIGIPVLTYFAMGPLGLGFVSRHDNVTVYSHHGAGELMTKEVGIEFELPYAEASQVKSSGEIQILKDKKVFKSKESSILSSLSDVSFINAQEVISNSFVSRATRVGIKYALAIAAAYTTYTQVKESSGEIFAKPAALAQFLVSQKGIKETEKADTRHWTTLANLHLSAEFNLPKGSYQARYIETSLKEGKKVITREVHLGALEVTSDKSIFSYRTF